MGRRKGTDDRAGVPDHADEDQESDTEVVIQVQTDQHQQLTAVQVEENQRFYDAAQSSIEVDRPREEDRPAENGEETRQRQFQAYMQSTLDLMTRTMGTIQEQVTGTMNCVQTVVQNINSNNSQAAAQSEHRYRNHQSSDQEATQEYNMDAAWNGPERYSHREDRRSYDHGSYRQASYSRPPQQGKDIKVPPYNGKDSWKVWINRFEAIAHRQQWTDEDKLDQLLPKLQGAAGEFAFSQLKTTVLYNYSQLIAELHSRFSVIETPKTYAAQFSRRFQKVEESVENYAAELKRLYDKGYKYRDQRTRQEDLVRRFLDGLVDDEARFEVEYHKEPSTIDDAVYQVVNFLQTKHQSNSAPYGERKMRKFVRRTTSPDDASDNEDFQADYYEHVCRVPSKKPSERVSPPKAEERENSTAQNKSTTDPSSAPMSNDTENILQRIINKIDQLSQNKQSNTHQVPRNRSNLCYFCSEPGHYARECPKKQGQGHGYQREQSSLSNRRPPGHIQGGVYQPANINSRLN